MMPTGHTTLPVRCLELSPLFATLTKTPGVYTQNSQFGTLRGSSTCGRSDASTFGVFPIYPLSFHIITHSFARSKNSTLLFSGDCALFAKNHPGWGEGEPC